LAKNNEIFFLVMLCTVAHLHVAKLYDDQQIL
jgi:hypothetical protein